MSVVSKSQNPGGSRFYEVGEGEVEQIRDNRHEMKTKKSTAWGLNMFREWLIARELSTEFELISSAELNTILSTFYVEARKEDGSQYSKSSINAIRASLQRHLQSAPWN